MKHLLLALCATVMATTSYASQAYAETTAPKPDAMKLYRLDCGTINVLDLNVFSDVDQYVGQTKQFTVSCYLIEKGENLILWDTGLPSALADAKDGTTNGVFHLTLKKTIKAQLAELDLTPEDITHVGLSHSHFDHAGNTNDFKNAQLIIQKKEYDFLTQHTEDALNYHMDASKLSHFIEDEDQSNIRILNGDTDLFEDGTLRTILLPGHTPGHMALHVKLAEFGDVILSGDQWHFEENREHNGVPSLNFDRADTLASSDKLERLIKNTGAKLIIQHEEKHIPVLPVFPKYAQ